ncbi:hypothetical protein HAX54_049437 [Datura stramonium]|uniref:RING-type E3 ubiquitin transferase n=1 Tax=Datura stramonium TaxID=4076 RepID=A0ABS8WMM2_DATST|nr:hypothetical protein [Datura stramonium]
MDDVSSSTSSKLDEAGVLALLGKILVGVIIFLSLVVIFIFFLHLYTRWFLNRRRQDTVGGTRRKVNSQGLDPLILETIPVLVFDAYELKEGTLECTICLCEFSEGEKMRFLPKCNHGFHVDCIDMCGFNLIPLALFVVTRFQRLRNHHWRQWSLLLLQLQQTSTSSRSHGMLVIDIPGQINEEVEEEEEAKSVMPERLRRLVRLLRRG